MARRFQSWSDAPASNGAWRDPDSVQGAINVHALMAGQGDKRGNDP
jgi:hypothetical protein